ncbi:thioredoxin-like protein [Trametes maxima]|nr:thioredoxin-like protein [Trametes maxima]
MDKTSQITFYTHVYPPYCHRVHIALEEANAGYTLYNVNIVDKPAWYSEKINKSGKIPSITYGGPRGAPENPSPEATILTESLIILEFLADLFPEARLLPNDPVLRARARLFANAVDTALLDGFGEFFVAYTKDGSLEDALLAELDALRARLPPTGFALGEWSNAEIAAAPSLVRTILLMGNDIGKYPVTRGKEVLAVLRGPRFERRMEYIERRGYHGTELTAYVAVIVRFETGIIACLFVIAHSGSSSGGTRVAGRSSSR